MNTPRTLMIGALIGAFAFAAAADNANPSSPVASKAPAMVVPAAPVQPPAPTYTNAQLTELYGWYIAKRTGLTEFPLTPDEAAGAIKGFTEGLNHQESPYDLQTVGPIMGKMLQKIQSDYLAGMKAKNKQEAADFFAHLKAGHPSVVQTPSGLRYEIGNPGSGAFPKPTDTVKVAYVGRLLDGTVFDKGTHEFELDRVIPGWTEGVGKIAKGGHITLYIPSELAYGDAPRTGIPPSSTLVFEVDLLDIVPPHAAAAPMVRPVMKPMVKPASVAPQPPAAKP